jgi:hypothetical protein
MRRGNVAEIGLQKLLNEFLPFLYCGTLIDQEKEFTERINFRVPVLPSCARPNTS